MKNKLLNFLTSLPSSGCSRKEQGHGLQSPKHTKTTVFGILTICMMFCGAHDALAQAYSCATGGLAITEVLVDPNGNSFNFDTDGDGTAATTDEFVKICNTSAAAIDVSGAQLSDPGNGEWFAFPAATTLAPGACVSVVGNYVGTPPAGIFSAGVNNGIINNSGDDISILDATGATCVTLTVGGGTDGCVQDASGATVGCDPATYEFSNAGSAGPPDPPTSNCPIIAAPTTENLIICQGDPTGALSALTATCVDCVDSANTTAGAAVVTWWNTAVATGSGTVATGTGAILDASGIIDANVPGMHFLYAQCGCGDCASDRTQLMVVINPAPSLDIDNIASPTCFIGADGTFAVSTQGGTAPFTYDFTNGVSTVLPSFTSSDPLTVMSGLMAGLYEITVTDANGCTDTGSVTLTAAESFLISDVTATNETCIGAEDGTITVIAATNGPDIEYGISPGFAFQPSPTFSGLAAGLYTVTVRDANSVGCSTSETMMVQAGSILGAPVVENYSVCVGESIPAGEGLAVRCSQATVSVVNTDSIAIPDADLTTLTCSEVAFAAPAGATILDISIDLAITHTYVGDLTASLTAPDGTSFSLFDRQGDPAVAFGCDEDDLSLTFSDSAPNSATDFEDACPAIVGGAYNPIDAFAALIGTDPNGTWSLCVSDAAAPDPGSIELFNVTITYAFNESTNITNIYTPAGVLVSTSSTFDPIAAGLVNNNIIGTYCFMATCSDGICESPAVEVCLDVTDVPAPIEIAGDLSVCANSETTYTALGDINSDYIWSVSGDGNQVVSSTGNTAEIIFGASTDGPFTVSASEVSGINCVTTSTTQVTVENQSQIACRSNLNVSLGSNCGADLDVSLFIKNAAYGADSYSIISAVDADGLDVIASGDGYTTGNSYSVMIEHACSGTRCWSTMVAEDKIAPTITCPEIEVLGCTAESKPVYPADYPEWADNCDDLSEANFTYTDNFDNAGCGVGFITRTWTVTDLSGNEGNTCDQVVTITRPAIEDIEFPDDITLECGTVFASDFEGVTIQGTDPDSYIIPGEGTQPDTLILGLDGMVSDLADENDGLDEDYPVLEGEDLSEKTCFFVASHSDQHVPNLCGESAKIIRTWTITDWCNGDQVTDIQIIKLLDTTAPVIVDCGGTIDVPAAAGSCEGYYGIPMPEILEECANPVTVTANLGEKINGVLVTYEIGDEVYIPEGGINMVYEATDACGNASFCTVTLNLIDVFAPVAICDANTTVSLSNFDQGLATVCWNTFDDGSFDNCEDNIVVKVKRADVGDSFGNCVNFECEDSGSTIAVRMRVYDVYLDDFAVAQSDTTYYAENDPSRRFSECEIQVLVQDKINAEISCSTRFIECIDAYNNTDDLGGTSFPNLTNNEAGTPVFCTNCPGTPATQVIGYRDASIFNTADNCPNGLFLEVTDNDQIVCGSSSSRVLRSWRLFDATGEELDNCTEQIRFTNNYHSWTPSEDGSPGVDVIDFNSDGDSIGLIVRNSDDYINWPGNEVYDCNSGTADQDVVALLATQRDVNDLVEGLDDDCSNLRLSVNDTEVTESSDACFKIVREWKIVDDCIFDPNFPQNGGFWTATSEVTIIDNTAPVFDDCSDKVFSVTAPNCAEADQVGCSGFADLAVNATDFCGNDAIVYRWFLDANSDGVIDLVGEGNDASGIYPIGKHNIRYEAEDGCGNVAVCSSDFVIADSKAPTPVCVVLTSTVMPSTGALEIWATDFDSGSSCDNCTAHSNLEFRINKGENATTPPSTSSITYDCSTENISFGAAMNVQVWVIDEAGNADFCVTQIAFTPINANDTDHPCFDGAQPLDIAGIVETEDHDMVDRVDVDVSSTTANPFTTSDNGLFSFFGVPAGGNYVVTPEKDINPLNGVTTYDLVLISQHILGVNLLDSPYKIIAADANNSGSVTTLDLVKIRSVILNIDQDFAPNNTSWRFVDMDFVFPVATNPFSTSFPEVIAYNNLANDELATDFVGVKVGDVNGSATPNNLIGSSTRNVDGTLIFDTEDIKLIKGNEYTIDFTATDFTDLLGYQYSIEFDADVLEFVNINKGELNDLTDANFGFSKLNEGVITTSWNSATATTMKDETVLFSLTFNAKENGQLSELMSASSNGVKAEAYTTNLDLLDVALAFNTENGTITSSESFELLQNVPNPFRTETVIGFNLEEATSATLRIMDVSGKVLKHIEGDFVRGYNEVKLNKLELQGVGVLHYQLDTPTNTATKKMILID